MLGIYLYTAVKWLYFWRTRNNSSSECFTIGFPNKVNISYALLTHKIDRKENKRLLRYE